MGAKLDPRVDIYVEGSAEFARPVLRHLRGLVHAACPEVEETIKWKMPFFLYRGRMVCAMMAFKAHCSFGLWGAEMKQILAAAGYARDDAAGSFGRIMSLKDLPEDRLLRGWLKQAFRLAAEEKPAKTATEGARRGAAKQDAKTVKASLKAPEDLAAELGKRAGTAENFAGLSPSCRREYLDWIDEAKRPETRARRIAQAAEWIAEGKRRNWKYEAC